MPGLDIQDLEHGVGQVQRTVLEDVDLDALQEGQAVHLLLHLGHLARLGDQALSVEAVHHGDARRVVGDAEVGVAQRLRPLRHLEHRRPAVAPAGMRVHVALVGAEIEVGLIDAGGLLELLAQAIQVPTLARLD